jgi:hypothetical protein
MPVPEHAAVDRRRLGRVQVTKGYMLQRRGHWSQ